MSNFDTHNQPDTSSQKNKKMEDFEKKHKSEGQTKGGEIPLKYKFYCHGCAKNFETHEEVDNCIKCNSEFIHQVGVEEDPKSKNKLTMQNLYKSFTSGSYTVFNKFSEAVSEMGKGAKEIAYDVKKDAGPQLNKAKYELSTVKDIKLSRTKQNEEGEEEKEEVDLDKCISRLIKKFKLEEEGHHSDPANDESLDKLKEAKINENDYIQIGTSTHKIAPKCNICDHQMKDNALETACNHTFHKDCLLPWLRIHNRCPDCKNVATG